MGQPINLEREDEKLVVYGPNQARVMIAQGWKHDGEEEETVALGPVDDLTKIKGVGAATAAILADAGLNTYEKIANVPKDDLVALDKISLPAAVRIQKGAADLVK
jgi:predicted flap endonuclease-1-like 5' DNA nuclease